MKIKLFAILLLLGTPIAHADIFSYTINNKVYTFAELMQKADGGDAEAQYRVGYILSVGDGVEKDVKNAIEWYKKASKQGNTASMFNLAYLYDKGEIGIEKNPKESLKWIKMGADHGDVAAQNVLGDIYYAGDGVKQNFKEAAKWYSLAIRSNMLNPYVSLGKMYFKGEGVEKNHKMAYELIYAASTVGYTPAKKFIETYNFELTTKEKAAIENQVKTHQEQCHPCDNDHK